MPTPPFSTKFIVLALILSLELSWSLIELSKGYINFRRNPGVYPEAIRDSIPTIRAWSYISQRVLQDSKTFRPNRIYWKNISSGKGVSDADFLHEHRHITAHSDCGLDTINGYKNKSHDPIGFKLYAEEQNEITKPEKGKIKAKKWKRIHTKTKGPYKVKQPKKVEKDSETKYIPESSSKVENSDGKTVGSPEGDDHLTPLSISKRMLHSIFGILSSQYCPNSYHILPILYHLRDGQKTDFQHYWTKFAGSESDEKGSVSLPPTCPISSKENKKLVKLTKQSKHMRHRLTRTERYKEISAIFLRSSEDPKDTSELVLSIPSSVLDRLSQSPKYNSVVEITDDPISLITLKEGFISKMYDMIIRPELINIIEKSFLYRIDEPCGFMDAATIPTKHNSITKESIKDAFDNLKHRKNEVNIKNLSKYMSEPTRRELAIIFKSTKDIVFMNSCSLLLEKIIGRPTIDSELAYAFGYKSEDEFRNRVYCSRYDLEQRLNSLAIPLTDLVMDKIQRRMKSKNIISAICVSHKNTVELIKQKICAVHLNFSEAFFSSIVNAIFATAYRGGKREVLKATLPDHLPLGTLKLAKKAIEAKETLMYEQMATIKELNFSKRMGVPSSEFDNDFSRTVADIERKYGKVEKGSIKALLKKQEQKELLDRELSKRLKTDMDRINDAVSALECKVVSPYTRIPKEARRRGPYSDTLRGKMRGKKYYGEIDDFDIPDDPEDDPNALREDVLTRSMRRLIIEALDDRIAKFIYMATYGLFTRGKWTTEKLIESLRIKVDKEVLGFILYTSILRCQEYESWRIKLELPPYVNEWDVDPRIIKYCALEGPNIPHHLNTSLKEAIKRAEYPTFFARGESEDYEGSRSKENRILRQEKIKPRMRSIEDIILNHKKEIKDTDRILELSPLNYLDDTGLCDPA